MAEPEQDEPAGTRPFLGELWNFVFVVGVLGVCSSVTVVLVLISVLSCVDFCYCCLLFRSVCYLLLSSCLLIFC